MLGAAAALLASTAVQAQMKPEEMVETRQAGYQFMSWNMGKIKAQVIDGKEPFDQAKVAAAADVIAAIANSGMGSLFNTAANQLASVAKSGDQAAIKKAFGDVGASCKSCHDKFRAD
ncbi:c-type cytochrome [Stutzerimonas balearica]|uniref:c-type cytochrome n=1 Tax=Stutzerimonas balearica TaxID=74829 RepID=UPI0028A63BA6|nr:cytochrome c [Stutzerimonas balearica]